ncbi:MAG: hypothetical protein HOP29_01450 [Phycisphaerales bacterium]|nr:hypothetical protein [Phycisphaerales bacterium]
MSGETNRPWRRATFVAGVAATLAWAVQPVAASGPVSPGDDLWVTPCGGGTYDYQTISAGFFTSLGGSSSVEYNSGVVLGGVPLTIFPTPVPNAPVDTIVRRLAPTAPTFTTGSVGELIPIEIVALHLASCDPITVTYANSSTEQWDVDVCLDATQTTGTMTLNHECAEGGSYTNTLPVNAVLTFSRVGGGVGSPVSLTTTLSLTATGWWTHSGSASGPTLSHLDPGTSFDSDCDGLVDTATNNGFAAGDFFPGQWMEGCGAPLPAGVGPCCDPQPPFQPGCGDPACEQCVCGINPACCFGGWDVGCGGLANGPCQLACECGGGGQPPDIRKPGISPELAMLIAHGIAPANPGKIPNDDKVTAACCKPAKLPGTRCIDVLPLECTQIWQGQPFIGDNCVTVTCPNDPPPYENWVIADDFCVECPDCTCDFNADGLCNATDQGFIASCFGGGGAAGCDRADLNCDGLINLGDLGVYQCLATGGLDCCNTAAPRRSVDRIRWYGSYFDSAFEPPVGGGTSLRNPDGWFVAVHEDVPPTACGPTPPGLAPIDLCGTLIQGVEAGCILFQPKGSSFQYLIFNPAALGTYGVGSMVRICGYLNPSLITTCQQGLGPLVVNAVGGASDCNTAVSRPGNLLIQWVVPNNQVTRTDISKTGWDGHRIFCYDVDLPQCLDHNFAAPDEFDPTTGVFTPRPSKTYWLSIQAEVGLVPIPGPIPGQWQGIKTGETITQDFWGWHTTPPGYQHKDDAFMGSLHMGCPGEWVYHWMNELHCSQPAYTQCCDDPTKSIDMAFYLLNLHKYGTCENGMACQTDANCADGTPCRKALWCQPVNPGVPALPQPRPPIRKYPKGGVDEMPVTTAQVTIALNAFPGQMFDLQLQGPTVISRTNKLPGAPQIETEIIAMDLVGAHPVLGAVRMTLNPNQQSHGAVVSEPPPALELPSVDSFFDVFVDMELQGMGMTVRALNAVHVVGGPVIELPPAELWFVTPNGQPDVPFTNVGGGPIVGVIKFVSHCTPPPKHGVNIHSDTSWEEIPDDPCDTGACCELSALGNGCLITTLADCQGTWLGPNVPCGPLGACCINGTCQIMFQSCCEAQGGMFTGAATCGNQGKCCDAAGNCSIEFSECCNGTFIAGALTPCTPQPCCVNGVCSNLDPDCCAMIPGASVQPAGSMCGAATEACCIPNPGGGCLNMDPLCCDEAGGTPQGAGSTCLGDLNPMNGTDDACEPPNSVCPLLPAPPVSPCANLQTQDCQTTIVPTQENCQPRCAQVVQGNVTVIECDCRLPNDCHLDVTPGVVPFCTGACPTNETCEETITPIAGGGYEICCDCTPVVVDCEPDLSGVADCLPFACPPSPTPAGAPCVVPDNGGGTITLPPAGCGGYVSPQDLHEMIAGLPAGATIEVDANHDKFFNQTEMPGGSLGGAIETFDSFLFMQMQGTGPLGGFNRNIAMQVQCQTHTGPRTPGSEVQSFPTEMFMLQGQLPPGDPDFDLLRIRAGTGFGMPSPGHTTLVRQGPPGSGFAVDSFFDIFYEIEFQGAPGSLLAGMMGSTTGTIRMGIGQAGNDQCIPRCMDYNVLTGVTSVADCECRDPNSCQVVEAPVPGLAPRCVGLCVPGMTCVETVVPLGGGINRICCDCAAPACTTQEDCDDNDVCTWDQCTAAGCTHTQNVFGDVNHDGMVDIFDILCVLDGFAGVFTTCSSLDTDLADCTGDGMHDIFDILGVLDAFSGVNSCNCSAGPSPASPVGDDAALRSDASRAIAPVSLQLVPEKSAVRAGQDVIVHVYADGVADFRGYQLAVDAGGGRSGALELRNLAVNVNHKSYVFGHHESYRAQDLSTGRLAAAVGAGSVTNPGKAYLGSFTFHASDDASGTFRLAVRDGENATVLVGSGRRVIPLRSNAEVTVYVR